MLIEITANQAKVMCLLVECMTAEAFPGLEPADFEDAWAVHECISHAGRPAEQRDDSG